VEQVAAEEKVSDQEERTCPYRREAIHLKPHDALGTPDPRSALMTRTKLLAAVAAAALAAAAGASNATAYNPDNANTPQVAIDNCFTSIDRQTAKGVSAGGGPKAGVPAPTNCDKFFGAPGKP
jgi:hypothetical protein